MIKWIAIGAVLLALVGGIVWAATMSSGPCAAGPMQGQHTMMDGGCQATAGTCAQAAGEMPAACHGAPAGCPHAQGGAAPSGCPMGHGGAGH